MGNSMARLAAYWEEEGSAMARTYREIAIEEMLEAPSSAAGAPEIALRHVPRSDQPEPIGRREVGDRDAAVMRERLRHRALVELGGLIPSQHPDTNFGNKGALGSI